MQSMQYFLSLNTIPLANLPFCQLIHVENTFPVLIVNTISSVCSGVRGKGRGWVQGLMISASHDSIGMF